MANIIQAADIFLRMDKRIIVRKDLKLVLPVFLASLVLFKFRA